MRKLKSILEAMGNTPIDSNVTVIVASEHECICMKCGNEDVIIHSEGGMGNGTYFNKAKFCWNCGAALIYPSTFSPNSWR